MLLSSVYVETFLNKPGNGMNIIAYAWLAVKTPAVLLVLVNLALSLCDFAPES
jgi:hypothetical protein